MSMTSSEMFSPATDTSSHNERVPTRTAPGVFESHSTRRPVGASPWKWVG